MKHIIIPLLKLLYTIILVLICLPTTICLYIILFFWEFSFKSKHYEDINYIHYYPGPGFDGDTLANMFMMKDNWYSAYFKHNKYKDKYTKIYFKTVIHYILGCKPFKTE